MSFKSVFMYTSISTFVRVISGIAINKILAIFIGPSGLAMYGNYMNFATILAIGGSGSSQTAITKLLAGSGSRKETKELLFSSLVIIFSLSLVISCLSFLFIENIAEYIFRDASLHSYVYLSIAIMWISVFNLSFLAILNGLKEYKYYALFNMLVAFGPAILIFFLRSYVDIFYIMSSYLFSNIAISICLSILLLPFFKSLKYENSYLSIQLIKKLFKFGITSMLTGIIVTLSLLIFRSIIISFSSEGLFDAGLWEALYRLTTFYNLLLFSPIAIYFLPKFVSELRFFERKNIMFKLAIIIFAISIFLFIFLDFFSVFIINLLFSNDFISIAIFLKYILLAESFRIIGSIFHLENIVKERFKTIVSIELFSFSSFIVIFYLCNSIYGYSLYIATLSYMVCTALFMIFNIISFYIFYSRDEGISNA